MIANDTVAITNYMYMQLYQSKRIVNIISITKLFKLSEKNPANPQGLTVHDL